MRGQFPLAHSQIDFKKVTMQLKSPNIHDEDHTSGFERNFNFCFSLNMPCDLEANTMQGQRRLNKHTGPQERNLIRRYMSDFKKPDNGPHQANPKTKIPLAQSCSYKMKQQTTTDNITRPQMKSTRIPPPTTENNTNKNVHINGRA